MVPPLPFDILYNIIRLLPSSRDDDGESAVKTIIRCSQVNCAFREAASSPNLWERHYNARYQHSIAANEARRTEEVGGDWRHKYSIRRSIDNDALRRLDEIVMKRPGRYEHAKALSRLSFDVWDVLEIELERMESHRLLRIWEPGVEPPVLPTRAYWISALMTAISQTYAVELWGRLRLESDAVHFVEAFSAISCWFSKHPKEIHNILSQLDFRCRNYLVGLNVPLSQEDPGYDIRRICVHTCEFMRSEGFGPLTGWRSIETLFPHNYLTTHKLTIPLSLAHVFVSLARSLGVSAHPVNFPNMVMVHVSVPDPTADDFYIDVFGDPAQAILSLRDDIPRLLSRQLIPPGNMGDWIAPCRARPMLVRSGNNILFTLNQGRLSMHLHRSSALLAFTLSMIYSGVQALVEQIISLAEPLECATFVSEALIPCLDDGSSIREGLSAACQEALDEEAKVATKVRLRSSEDTSVQHFVGMLFEHQRYSYIGLIYGWDPVCQAPESWLREMRVESLPRGRFQPFYLVICQDSSTRYVAEENIKPLTLVSDDLIMAFSRGISFLPKYFTGATRAAEQTSADNETQMKSTKLSSRQGRARFALSPEQKLAYPEDNAFGEAWLRASRNSV